MADDPKSKGNLTLTDADISSRRATRRELLLASLGIAAAGAMAVVSPAQAQYNCTDSDPSDSPGRGRYCGPSRTGCSDSDPNDSPGYGRRCGYVPPYRSCSDSDPSDRPGYGRRC
jgi:hypothetical protein